MFTNKDLKNLILPLFVEQFLLMFVGIADTFVASFSSEADVSSVSLPFLAVYDAGAALCRNSGKTDVTMKIFLINNIFNGPAYPLCRFAGQRASRGRGRKVYHGRFDHADHRGTAFLLGFVWPVAGLERHRRGDRHEHRSGVPRCHFYLAVEIRKVDEIPTDLNYRMPAGAGKCPGTVFFIYCTKIHTQPGWGEK